MTGTVRTYFTVPIQNKAPFCVFTTSTLDYIISNDIWYNEEAFSLELTGSSALLTDIHYIRYL